MKIVGGLKKGRRLKVAKKGIRPTRALVREAIFNIIAEHLPDCLVLDIFAGSGALGLEALSRGAKACYFIDKTTKTLKDNIKILELEDRTTVITADFRIGLKKLKGKKFDLFLIDPPYKEKFAEKALSIITQYDMFKPKSMVIIESAPGSELNIPESFDIIKNKKYGNTLILVLRTKNQCITIKKL